jgi:hypothetical protein
MLLRVGVDAAFVVGPTSFLESPPPQPNPVSNGADAVSVMGPTSFFYQLHPKPCSFHGIAA